MFSIPPQSLDEFDKYIQCTIDRLEKAQEEMEAFREELLSFRSTLIDIEQLEIDREWNRYTDEERYLL